MGSILSRRIAGVEDIDIQANSAYRYPPKSGERPAPRAYGKARAGTLARRARGRGLGAGRPARRPLGLVPTRSLCAAPRPRPLGVSGGPGGTCPSRTRRCHCPAWVTLGQSLCPGRFSSVLVTRRSSWGKA